MSRSCWVAESGTAAKPATASKTGSSTGFSFRSATPTPGRWSNFSAPSLPPTCCWPARSSHSQEPRSTSNSTDTFSWRSPTTSTSRSSDTRRACASPIGSPGRCGPTTQPNMKSADKPCCLPTSASELSCRRTRRPTLPSPRQRTQRPPLRIRCAPRRHPHLEIVSIVTYRSGVTLAPTDLDHRRFVVHLQFFADRLFTGRLLTSDGGFLYNQINAKYPQAIGVARLIGQHVRSQHGLELPDDELGYLGLHVQRLLDKGAHSPA